MGIYSMYIIICESMALVVVCLTTLAEEDDTVSEHYHT